LPLARDDFSWKRHRTHFCFFEHDPFGEPGTRVSGSRTWKRSILQRFASQRKPAFGGDHYSSGRIFRTCTTGFSALAQQENMMMSGSQCRRFSGSRRELRQRGHRATSGKFLLFTEV
jgi:hypothetical protein